MARPRIRTAELAEESRLMFRERFGRSTTAYTNLMAGHEQEVTYWTFQRAWTGEKVKPEDVLAIERGWVRYLALLTKHRQEWLGPSDSAAVPSSPSEPRQSPPEGVQQAG